MSTETILALASVVLFLGCIVFAFVAGMKCERWRWQTNLRTHARGLLFFHR